MKRLACAVAIAALAAFPAACGKKKDNKDKPAPVVKNPPPKPEEQPKPTGPDPKLVERGAYVANMGNCVMCHTAIGPHGPDLDNAFSGGLEVTEDMPGMQFTWRSPNITPDPDTGIGKWSDEQIMAAVREGVRPDGNRLAPMMPYMAFNAMSDDDASALVAFLRSLKPVNHKVERLPLPEQFAKMPPMPKPSGAAPAEEKKGEYMATIMHCSMCHTPMTPQGPDMKRPFAGGTPMKLPKEFATRGTGTTFPANLTSDEETGLGKWTAEQIATTIKTMKRPDGRLIGPPMLMYQGSWSQLKDDDLLAVANYIKTIPPIKNKVPKSTFKPSEAFMRMMAGPPPGQDPGAPPGGSPPAK